MESMQLLRGPCGAYWKLAMNTLQQPYTVRAEINELAAHLF